MTFTVVGATGSIGSRLVETLRTAGVETYAPPRGDSGLFERPLGHVVYCAGVTADFRSRPFETVDAHVGLLREILERGAYTSVLYLSSTRVYRGLERGEEDAPLVVRPADPDDLYNASKLLGESLCLSVAGGRVARLANVVGPGADSPSFVRALVEEALGTGTIHLESHPDSVKDYVDIRDVVQLLPSLVEGRERIYNVASGRQTTNAEIAELVSSLTGCEVVVDREAPLASFPPLSNRRIVEEFGFEARPLRDSLEAMVGPADG